MNQLDRFDPELLFPLFITTMCVVVGSAVAVLAIVTYHVRRIRERRITCQLVQDMLARGISGEEIALIVRALGDHELPEGERPVVSQPARSAYKPPRQTVEAV